MGEGWARRVARQVDNCAWLGAWVGTWANGWVVMRGSVGRRMGAWIDGRVGGLLGDWVHGWLLRRGVGGWMGKWNNG
jgi:hypothetical protein